MRFNLCIFLLVIFLVTGCGRNAQGCFDYEQTGLLTISFDASCSKKSYFFHWRFVDGSKYYDTITSSPYFKHTFGKAGTYEIVLIVGDKKNRTKRLIGGVPSVSKEVVVN